MSKVYQRDGRYVYEDSCNRFVYDVYVCVQYDNIFSTAQHNVYSSDVEIPGIVEYLEINKYISVECIMRSAPIRWLIDNDYTVYIPPIKGKMLYKKKKDE